MSSIVRVPVCPARDGNRFWKVMTIVGTSRTQTVPAAPNVNVSGSVDVDVLDDVVGDDVDVVDVAVTTVVDGGDEVVVVGATDEDVVVVEVGADVEDVTLDVVVESSVVVLEGVEDDGVVVVVVVDVVTSVGTVRGLVPTTVDVPATVVVV
jgi:hypothetical protein